MKRKSTGEVRASGKDIKPFLSALLLFSVLGGLAWNTASTRFHIFIIMETGFLLCAIMYMAARRKNWKINLSDETLYIRGTFGQTKQFPRDRVRWTVSIPWGSRIYHIRLYDYETGKQIVKVPLDWINVKTLFSLPHYGRMTSEERSAYNFFRQQ